MFHNPHALKMKDGRMLDVFALRDTTAIDSNNVFQLSHVAQMKRWLMVCAGALMDTFATITMFVSGGLSVILMRDITLPLIDVNAILAM